MVFVTLAQDDQIVIIDIEDEDIDDRDRAELKNDKECNQMTAKLVKQKIKSPNHLLSKAVQVKEIIIYFLHLIASLPFIIYHLYRQCSQDIGGQFIMNKQ